MKSYPAKFKSFQRKIVQMGASQKLQKSIQILIILWLVYPILTNSLFSVIFEELPFCHFLPLNTSILSKDSNLVDLSFEYLSFTNKRKTTILIPSFLAFLQLPIRCEARNAGSQSGWKPRPQVVKTTFYLPRQNMIPRPKLIV